MHEVSVCMCYIYVVYAHLCLQVHASAHLHGGQSRTHALVFCFLTPHIIPVSKGLSLNVELGW